MRLFGTSGIRRSVDFSLVQLALQVGMAVGSQYKNVVVGCDTRTSGSTVRHALTAGILAAGSHCYNAGVMPTPTLAYLTREYAAGMMITASHNPPQYNGIKMLNPDGSAFSSLQQETIEDLVNSTGKMDAAWEKMLSDEDDKSGVEKHLARILQDFKGGIKARVVVDGGCGAGYYITPELLKRLGCEVIAVNCYPNGVFPHDVEPIEANLGVLMGKVKDTGADLGIAHDGDADRMMAVDDCGRFINGDKMLAILSKYSGSAKIVTTIDASMSIEEMNFEVARTRVGDPYVSEELKKGGGFGGEPSGAWVFPGVSYCPDGVYAAAVITAIAARSKLAELVDSIPSYPVKRGNIPGTIENIDGLQKRLKERFHPLAVDTIDGLKMNLADGWVLIRPSGTEPKIRISSEARTEQIAGEYYRESLEIIKEFIQGKG
jgi:phosphoglucosamine mutase